MRHHLGSCSRVRGPPAATPAPMRASPSPLPGTRFNCWSGALERLVILGQPLPNAELLSPPFGVRLAYINHPNRTSAARMVSPFGRVAAAWDTIVIQECEMNKDLSRSTWTSLWTLARMTVSQRWTRRAGREPTSLTTCTDILWARADPPRNPMLQNGCLSIQTP